MKYIYIVILIISGNICDSQNLTNLKQSFLIKGQYFDKNNNTFLPVSGIIVINNSAEVIRVENGVFEIYFPDTSKIIFPMKIVFQCIGYKDKSIYFEKRDDFLNSKNTIAVYFEPLNESGLVLKAKTSVWYKVKQFFNNLFKNKSKKTAHNSRFTQLRILW